ncbi:MAG TPA: site-specific integrase, partial [Thermoplasmata archaeon]|nr:site-specific integrase [Thermoplasmata archaeon]
FFKNAKHKALELKVGDIQRELELGNVPLAINFLPKKDRETIKERITFLASDGIEILKQYLEWRKKKGEVVTEESPLFVGRTKRGVRSITSLRFNQTIKRAAKKAGLNEDNKYGTMRTHGLRKFFITQLTNHGVEDKIINFFICHKIPDIDRVYWSRRVEQLRKIYEERQQYLNPINGKKHTFDLKKLKG